jgi:hypothetical protein
LDPIGYETLEDALNGMVTLFSLLDEFSPLDAQKGPFMRFLFQKAYEKSETFPTLSTKINSSTINLTIPMQKGRSVV